MTGTVINSWQDIETEILDRINARVWKPGDIIPKEAELAREFGCARATVNRALRSIAETGLLERRRKSGTRVAVLPARKATFSIPVIRKEIEDRNQRYSYVLIEREIAAPPVEIRAKLQTPVDEKLLHVMSVHLADGSPYVCEDRWINSEAVPEILNVDLQAVNANEWLIANAPYTSGDFEFSAIKASQRLVELLGAEEGDPLFVLKRITWNNETAITAVSLTYQPGYRLHSSL